MGVKLTARKYVRVEIDVNLFSVLLSRSRWFINFDYELSDGGSISSRIESFLFATGNPSNPYLEAFGCIVTPENGTFTFTRVLNLYGAPGDKYLNSPYPYPHLEYFFSDNGNWAEFYVIDQYFNFWCADFPDHDSVESANVIWKRLGEPVGIGNDNSITDNWTYGSSFFGIYPTSKNYRLYNVTLMPGIIDKYVSGGASVLYGCFRPFVFVREEYIDYTNGAVDADESTFPYTMAKPVYEWCLNSPYGDWESAPKGEDYLEAWTDVWFSICKDKYAEQMEEGYRYFVWVPLCSDRPEWLDIYTEYKPVLVVRSDFADVLSSGGEHISISWIEVVSDGEIIDIVASESYREDRKGHEEPIIEAPPPDYADLVVTDYTGILNLEIKGLLCETGVLLVQGEQEEVMNMYFKFGDSEDVVIDYFLLFRSWLVMRYSWPTWAAYRSYPPSFTCVIGHYFKDGAPLWPPIGDRYYPSDIIVHMDRGIGSLQSKIYITKGCSTTSKLFELEQKSMGVRGAFLDEYHEFFDFSVERWTSEREKTGLSFTFL